jgi:hypothetical protein
MALSELAASADKAAASMGRLANARARELADALRRGQAPDLVEQIKKAAGTK